MSTVKKITRKSILLRFSEEVYRQIVDSAEKGCLRPATFCRQAILKAIKKRNQQE
jgi:hypothetical protein